VLGIEISLDFRLDNLTRVFYNNNYLQCKFAKIIFNKLVKSRLINNKNARRNEE